MNKKIIILGANGLLGKNLVKTSHNKNYSFVSLGRKDCDINFDLINDSNLKNILNKISPNIIINATGLTSLIDCEKNYDNCYKINTKIVSNVINLKLKKNLNLSKYLQTKYMMEKKIFQI